MMKPQPSQQELDHELLMKIVHDRFKIEMPRNRPLSRRLNGIYIQLHNNRSQEVAAFMEYEKGLRRKP